MIVIEGPDNCGKTTLAEELAIRLDLPVIHSIKPIDISHGLDRLDKMARLPHAIYDRVSCISEAVYGPICRDGSIYRDVHWEVADRFLHHKPLVIFCCCSLNRALEFNGREDMEGVQENAVELFESYRVVMSKVRVLSLMNDSRYMSYNYEMDSVESVEGVCREYLSQLEFRQNSINELGEG